jgi:protein Tex
MVVSVNESGASIYSASPVAREEFPEYDVTVRSAISIGRRLIDPLAELVKIDPKSIGVGQYQHDVDEELLNDKLTQTVSSCVNNVGVNVNTASKQLLSYVSGIGPAMATNIVEFRNKNGYFKSKKELMNVPRLGATTFEQCAGFLRIPQAENVLDNTGVHPERYSVVAKMCKDTGSNINEFIKEKKFAQLPLEKYVDYELGIPTLKDLINELNKPGHDPRKQFKQIQFNDTITKPEHLQIGMRLNGIVTNVTAFGCFVDIGVHQDGLVHISNITNQFISDPAQVVSVGKIVNVKVIDVDLARKRIGLSMKE